MVKVQYPLEYQEGTDVSVVGTFDGVVLLSLTNRELLRSAQKWDVFDLKTSLWSTQPQYLENTYFLGDMGVFINGFLYWGIVHGILALDVREMVFSKIKLPVEVRDLFHVLGSIDGRLCVMKYVNITTFHLWFMKDDRSWMRTHSLTFNLDSGNEWRRMLYPICILDNGKILMANNLVQFAIYDTSTHSNKTLNGLDDVKWRDNSFVFEDNRAREYVESLVSPSDMCGI
ncbi:F-box/kelch-repeat protein At3g06240-like [Bidens hawaiensis]|uniref:F-box/kelch-repeat protein At3g06240-like n=1 Tax=Bidens hawaiensis TaxID=980011 RepID=UPI004049E4C0